MADLIEIGIEVRGRDGIRSATREIDALGNTVKSAERSASAFIKIFEQQERQLKAAENANRRFAQAQEEAARASQDFYKSMQQVNLANKSAADSFSVYEKRIDQLRAKYNPLYASSKQYETMLNEINEAHRLGAITAKQFEAAQERLTQEFTNGTGAFSKYASQTSQRLNQMGVVTQQVGYQVGDFLVQVQSGTNFLVAFGQQATQLVGILPLMGAGFMGLSQTALIGLSAGLGIAIPLVTAIGAAILRTSESSDKGKDKVKGFSDVLGDLAGVVKSTESELRLLHSVFEDIEALRAQDKIESLKDRIESLKEAAQLAERSGGGYGKAAAAGLEAARAQREEEIRILEQKLAQYEAAKQLLSIEESAKELLKEIQEIEEATADKQTEVLGSLRERQQLAKAYLERGEEGLRQEERIQEAMALVKELQSEKYDLSKTELSVILQQLKATYDLEDAVSNAKTETEMLADAARDAAAAFERMVSFSSSLEGKVAVARAQLEALNAGQDKRIAGEVALLKIKNDQLLNQEALTGEALEAANLEYNKNLELISVYEETTKAIEDKEDQLKALGRSGKKALTDLEREAERLRKELESPMVSAIGSVSNAFGDFIARGLTDFKGFVQQILGSFQNMIAQMIAMAVRNRIMLSFGLGGITPGAVAAGQVAGLGGAAAAGPVGSFIGSFGAAGVAGSGLLGGFGAAMPSFLGGAGNGLFAVGANAAAAGGTFAATIGAIAAPLLAVTAIFSFFKKKVKELDSGLQGTVKTLDATIQSFRTIETKRFWGLSKKVTTEVSQLGREASDPIVESIVNIQKSIMEAASAFGISGDVFDNFIYNLKISLKGLSEDQQAEKIQEELTKMGDAFAALTGHFQTMNELIEAANQRYQIQNRILQAQNAQAELLARQREAEMASVHELNKSLLQAAFNLEDARAAMDSSLSAIQVSIQQQSAQIQKDAQDKIQQLNDNAAAQIESIRNNSEAQIEALQSSIDSVVSGFETSLKGAEEALSRSSDVFGALSDTLNNRLSTPLTDQQFSVRRSQAFGFLSSIEDLRSVDTDRLERALDTVSEPSEQLFGNFVDYARDFNITTGIISELTNTAESQLSADQQMVDLLEQQLEQAKDSNTSQIDAIRELAEKQVEAIQSALSSQVDGIQSSSQSQIEALQAQYDIALKQYNAALGIDDSVKSVGAAIGDLTKAIENFMLASKQAELESTAAQYISKTTGQIVLNNQEELLKLAGMANVATTGKTGGDIVKQISDYYGKPVTGTVVSDDAIWNKQFAMGGYHTGGVRMVGERGPEIEATGPARIFSYNQTASMFRDPDLREAIRNLKEEVSGLRTEQRQIQMDISKYTKRSYDIERKWDTEGLPATRT